MREKSQNGKSAASSDEIEMFKQEVETNRMLTKENCELKHKIDQLRSEHEGSVPQAVCRIIDGPIVINPDIEVEEVAGNNEHQVEDNNTRRPVWL